MSKRELKILLIDDDHDDAEIFKWHLEKVPSYKSTLVHVTGPDAPDAQQHLREADATFLDYKLAGRTALEVLEGLREGGDVKPVVILTGQGDERVAARLMRAGADEYLTKDELSPERLSEVIAEALQQYQQRLSDQRLRSQVDSLGEEIRQLERERSDGSNMLTQTLLGSAKIMVEMLRFRRPQILSVVTRLKSCVKKMLAHAEFEPDWRIDLATTLSHVGLIAVSQDICCSYVEGLPLNPRQRAEFGRHPGIGHDLVLNIPRFDEVALMILFQAFADSGDDSAFDSIGPGHSAAGLTAEDFSSDRTYVEAQVLRVAVAYDGWLRRGVTPRGAVSRLRSHSQFDNSVVQMLEASLRFGGETRPGRRRAVPTKGPLADGGTRKVNLWQLASGMVLAEDLTTADGTAVVLGKGQTLTDSELDQLGEFMTHHDMPEAVAVLSSRNGMPAENMREAAVRA